MKKIVYSLIITSLFLIPSIVFAEGEKINLSCTPSSALPGDSISCVIGGEASSLAKDSSFTGKVQLSSNLEMASISTSQDWKASTSNNTSNGIFDLVSTKAQSSSFEIATFTVKIKSDSTESGTVTLNTTTFGTAKSIDPVTQTITMKSNVTDTSDPKLGDDTTTTDNVNADVKNPDTGSNIPFAIIGAGTILVIVFYEIATKNKKIHKI